MQTDMSDPPSDLELLQTIFSTRPALHTKFLEVVLHAHGTVSHACDYLSSMPDSDVPSTQAMTTWSSSTSTEGLCDVSAHGHQEEEEGNIQTVIHNLIEVVVPSLRQRLTGMSLPTIQVHRDGHDDRNTTTTNDRLQYALEDMKITSFNLQQDDISTNLQNNTINIIARNIDVDISIGHWSYRVKFPFPPIRDSGHATLQFRNVYVSVTLQQQQQHIAVPQCACTIAGGFNFQTSNSRLSWLYNGIASAARNALRRTVQDALENAIRGAIEEQLTDWTSWAIPTV